MAKEYRYDAYAWEELKDAIKQARVVLLPVGYVEQMRQSEVLKRNYRYPVEV